MGPFGNFQDAATIGYPAGQGTPGFQGQGDPFSSGLLAMLAAKNPQLIAQVAAAHGIPPPAQGAGGDMGPAVGAFMQPMAAGAMSPAGAPAAPAGQSPAAANPWAMMSGFKGAQTPAPIFNGGVSGAQKAPEMDMKGPMASNVAMQQLINQIIGTLGNQAPVSPVGGLGSFIGAR